MTHAAGGMVYMVLNTFWHSKNLKSQIPILYNLAVKGTAVTCSSRKPWVARLQVSFSLTLLASSPASRRDPVVVRLDVVTKEWASAFVTHLPKALGAQTVVVAPIVANLQVREASSVASTLRKSSVNE